MKQYIDRIMEAASAKTLINVSLNGVLTEETQFMREVVQKAKEIVQEYSATVADPMACVAKAVRADLVKYETLKDRYGIEFEYLVADEIDCLDAITNWKEQFELVEALADAIRIERILYHPGELEESLTATCRLKELGFITDISTMPSDILKAGVEENMLDRDVVYGVLYGSAHALLVTAAGCTRAQFVLWKKQFLEKGEM